MSAPTLMEEVGGGLSGVSGITKSSVGAGVALPLATLVFLGCAGARGFGAFFGAAFAFVVLTFGAGCLTTSDSCVLANGGGGARASSSSRFDSLAISLCCAATEAALTSCVSVLLAWVLGLDVSPGPATRVCNG